MHCAKSHRPFESFANVNCKLWNEAKMNATFERGSAQDPWRDPLSAEMNDASAWRIGVPVVWFVMTLCHNDSSCCTIQNKMSSRRFWEGASCSRYSTQAFGLGCCPEQPSSLLVKNWASGKLVPHAEERSFCDWVMNEWVLSEDTSVCVCPVLGIADEEVDVAWFVSTLGKPMLFC